MPTELFIDSNFGVVFSRTDVLRRDDLWDHRRQLLAHPDFRPQFHHWIEMRNLIVIDLSAEDIAHFAMSTVFSPSSKRAIVVGSDLQYGLGRMFEAYASGVFQIFRHAPEACAFLGISTEPPAHAYTRSG